MKYSLTRGRACPLPSIFALAWCLVLASGAFASETAQNWTYVDADGVVRAFASCDDNVVDGGVIGTNGRGCADPTFQPARLTNELAPSGGSGELEYLWMSTTSDPRGGQPVSWDIIPGSTSAEYVPEPITATHYYMRCSRRAGCEQWAGETNYVTITVDCCDPIADGGEIGGAQRSCGLPYDPTTLSNLRAADATGGLPIEYIWYASTSTDVFAVGSPAWSIVSSPATPFLDPAQITQTTYYVRVAQRERCDIPGAFSNVVTVEAYAQPTFKADIAAATCADAADGSIALTVLDAARPITLSWEDAPTAASVRSGLPAGLYTARVTDANGCDHRETFSVEAPEPLIATGAVDMDVCDFDGADVDASVTGGTAPYMYAWDSGATTEDLDDVPAGTYRLTVTDAQACTFELTVTVAPPQPLTLTSTATQPTCGAADGTIALTATGGAAPYQYVWTPDVRTNAPGDSAENLLGGDYDIVVTDANGCSASIEVSLDIVEPLAVTFDADEVECNGANDADVRTAVSGGTQPYSYLWSTGATTETLTGVGAGTYTLNITDGLGCTLEDDVTLGQPDALFASIDVIQPICAEDGGTLIATITGGTEPYTFFWGTDRQNTEQTQTDLPAGTYTFNVEDAGGCTFAVSATVDATTVLEVSTDSTDVDCPGDMNGTATVTIIGGQPGYSVAWSNGGAGTSITSLPAGLYTATVTDDRGCVKSANTTVQTRSTGPEIEGTLTQPTCAGADDGAVALVTTGGIAPYTYAWADDNGAGPDRSGLAPGRYTVRVTDAVGCFSEETYEFVEPAVLEVTAVPQTTYATYFHVSRFEAEDGALAAAITGGTEPYTVAWSNGQTGTDLSGLAGGAYTVTVTDANGCSVTHDTTLVEPSMISDYVWEDTDGDGLQDPDESGLAGVQVRLTGEDFMNVAVEVTATTDASGAYRFDQLAMGDYVLRFTPPVGEDFISSPADEGADDAVDSDINPRFRFVQRAVTAHGVGDYDTDAGFIPPTSVIEISDRVWYDTDHDGLQDEYESSVQGVTLELVRAVDDVVVDDAVTDEQGGYAFTEVTPGSYFIRFDQTTSSVGATFVATVANVGTDTLVDSDFDRVTRRTKVIVVTADSEDDSSYDLGLHEDCVTVADGGQIAGTEPVCIGDVPGAITSATPANGTIRYQWYTSTTEAQYRGALDPAWVAINGAIGLTYQPSTITETHHYIRLAADVSCGQDYTGASNIVTKTAIENPVAELTELSGSNGSPRQPNNEITLGRNETLSATASATGVVSFAWDFGLDATPRTATGQAVTGVDYADKNGSRSGSLVVTNASGCTDEVSFDVFTIPIDNVGEIDRPAAAGGSGSGATVRWSAVSLPEGAYFEVERAGARGAFEKIARVEAVGHGRWTDYLYEDRDAPAGGLVYRVIHRAPTKPLRNVDRVTAEIVGEGLVLLAFPNPVVHALTVEIASATGTSAEYTVTDVAGAVMYSGRLIERIVLPTEDWSAGIYYLSVTDADGVLNVRPIVKR